GGGEAISRARRALEDWVVLGVETNRTLLRAVLDSEEFLSGDYSVDLVSRLGPPQKRPVPDAAWIAAALAFSSAAAPAGARGGAAASEPWDAPGSWRTGS